MECVGEGKNVLSKYMDKRFVTFLCYYKVVTKKSIHYSHTVHEQTIICITIFQQVTSKWLQLVTFHVFFDTIRIFPIENYHSCLNIICLEITRVGKLFKIHESKVAMFIGLWLLYNGC